MIIRFEPEATQTLNDIASFIESINTEGAGDFWIDSFMQNLSTYALPNVEYALCRNVEFSLKGFSCINYNGWIIAFKIEAFEFIVYHIIRGNLLT